MKRIVALLIVAGLLAVFAVPALAATKSVRWAPRRSSAQAR